MEMPTLWECLEVFQLQKELAQEKYLIPLDKDCTNKLGCDASAKLQNRLTVQEYVWQIEMRKTWMCRYFVCKLLTKGIPEKIKP